MSEGVVDLLNMVFWTELIAGSSERDKGNLRKPSFNGTGPVVIWNVTKRCNLNCLHCYFDSGKDCYPQELDTKEAKDFIEDIAKLKVPVLIFSGGEALLRKDIFELARFAFKKRLRSALSTNGTLINEEVAKEIKSSGFYYVGISLDGKKETNDSFRQKRGSFKQALEGLRNCKKVGLKIGIRFTITKRNFEDLTSIFDLAEQEGVNRLCIYHLVYTGRARKLEIEDLDNIQKRVAMEFIFKKTISLYKRGSDIQVITVDNHADGVFLYLRLKEIDPKIAKKCLRVLRASGGNASGIRLAAVDSSGNVYPDQFWRTHPLGNLREKRFSEIWNDTTNSFLADLRNRKGLLKGRCRICRFLDLCNGNFRARAEAKFGDPWAEDPACYLTHI